MNRAIDIVLPVHNEGESIAQVLREFYDEAHCHGHAIRYVVCEDGSTDNTVAQIQEVGRSIPLLLITGRERKGYSRAVVDGLRATEADIVGFIDSDGQCDPADFDRLFRELLSSGADLIVGYRNPRRDHWIRLFMSWLFGGVYRLYFRVPLRDPSCPYFLIKREALLKLMQGNLGILRQGFWWEFFARAFANGLRVKEIPVTHRSRVAGTTQVYKASKIVAIAWTHLRGLKHLHAELNRL